MHLSPEQIEKAAERAVGNRYFSDDPGIGRDDLVAIAALRIVHRNPTTVGTAVFVGREGLYKELGYRRYQKHSEMTSLDALNGGHRVLRAGNEGQFEIAELGNDRATKNRAPARFQRAKSKVREIQGQLGQPLKMFGKYGLAYAIEQDFESDRFDMVIQAGKYDSELYETHFKRIKVYCSRITPAIRRLALRHYTIAFLK